MKSFFISVEGIDGAGKSTHVSFIKEHLEQKGLKVVVAREPGGTIIGEEIRNLLLRSHNMHRISELLLMFASRQELITNIIEPNLKQGISVVVDRYIDASIAYQGVGRDIGIAKVHQISACLEPYIQTDLTLLFDTPLAIALNRINKNRDKDRIENETESFFKKVQAAYYEMHKNEPDRIKLINTNQDKILTRQLIVNYLDELLVGNNE